MAYILASIGPTLPLAPLAALFGVGLCVCVVVGLWAARQDRRRP